MSNLVTSFFYLLHHMRLCTAPYRFQIRCRLKGNALISYYVNALITDSDFAFLVSHMIYLLDENQIISHSVNKSEIHPALSEITKFISLSIVIDLPTIDKICIVFYCKV